MPAIRQLPLSVVNKIAAGEVIERPASVVKELLENSVDAGAKRIEVSLGQGGTDLIRVSDDGCGISAEDLPLALASHATSKIADADDLFRVGTFGFRGEALASIAEVSHLVIRSRQADCDSGHEISVTGGVRRDITPVGCPPGTTIEIRNLFYNTPVRRKFLRASQTEIGHCSEAFTRIAIAQPNIHFTLRHNDKLLFDLPPTANWRERIAAFFGRDLEQRLIPLDNTDGDIRLFGYAADPEHSRANNRMQYVLLNGRFIRDRSLQHALGEAYRGLLLGGRFPIAFLRLDVPAEAVDVNVHPTKLEVRFADSGRIYSLLLGTIRKKFLATDLTARVQSAAGPDAGADTADATATQEHRRSLVEWAKGAIGPPSGTIALAENTDDSQSSLELRFEPPSGPPLELNRLDRSWQSAPLSLHQHQAAAHSGHATHSLPSPLPSPPAPISASKSTTATSSPKTKTVWSSSTSTPSTNAFSTNSSAKKFSPAKWKCNGSSSPSRSRSPPATRPPPSPPATL
jgi:DNA mismatch repair protein MutL